MSGKSRWKNKSQSSTNNQKLITKDFDCIFSDNIDKISIQIFFMEQKQQNRSGQSLIEEILHYGVLEPEKLTLQSLQKEIPKVGVLQRWRGCESTKVEGQDEEFEMWAFPDGIKIYDHNLNIINDSQPEFSFSATQQIGRSRDQSNEGPPNYIYSFVHTDYSLNRTYFSALCWHEKKYVPLKQTTRPLQRKIVYAKCLPKCTLWELQNDPLLFDKQLTLIYVPQVLIISSTSPLFEFQRQMLKFYYNNVVEKDLQGDLIRTELSEYFRDLVQVVGYPEAEKQFDKAQLEFKVSKYTQLKKQQLTSFYHSCLFLPKFKETVARIQVEDCINSSSKFTAVDNWNYKCFSCPNVNIIRILQKIGVKHTISLWKCFLLERHILVFGSDTSEIIDLFETILYLMAPIRWENIYIPFLPFHLVSNIDAIQSYLIGMSKIHMDDVINNYKEQMKDIVLFDLDSNILLENTLRQAHLPKPIENLITCRLSALGFKKEDLFSTFFKEKPAIMSPQEKVLRIKTIFLDALIYLLNNYRPFAYLKENQVLGFDREKYKSICSQKEWLSFAEQITETMIFVRLCEYHLNEEKKLQWNQTNLGGLFVYCQNIIHIKNKDQEFWRFPEPTLGEYKLNNVPYGQYMEYILKKDLFIIQKHTHVYHLEKYLIKYLAFKEKIQKDHENIARFSGRRTLQKESVLQKLMNFFCSWMRQNAVKITVEEKNRQANMVKLTQMVDLGKEFKKITEIIGHQSAAEKISALEAELLAKHKKEQNCQ